MDSFEAFLKQYENGTGWIFSEEDERDYSIYTPKVAQTLQDVGAPQSLINPVALGSSDEDDDTTEFAALEEELPSSVDLRQWFPDVQNQGVIQACTAHAIASQVAYYTKRTFGTPRLISRRFIYKVARNCLNWQGDKGAYIRATMAALAIFGAPPEDIWPYDTAKYDEEPTAFIYSYAQNNKAHAYYRLDTKGVDRSIYLQQCKRHISHGLPPTLGFSMFTSSIMQSYQSQTKGEVPLPGNNETSRGGHGVLLVGYDDSIVIKNEIIKDKQIKSKGAFIIRNCWGKEWGQEGYGYLPYDYILQEKAYDSWIVFEQSWLDNSVFESQVQ